jgi:hypothetical protein
MRQLFRAESVQKCAESNAGLPDLNRFLFEFPHEHGRHMIREARTMSPQLRLIGTIALASGLLGSGLGLGLLPNVAFAADDCLAAPNSPAPVNSHWYYRTDRTQDRKCWHLQTDNGQSQQGIVQAARETPAKLSQSVAPDPQAGRGFKDLVAQNGGAKLSDKDVEELYAEFLEWKRRTKN